MKNIYIYLFFCLSFLSSFGQTELLLNGNFSQTVSGWNRTGYFSYNSNYSTCNSCPGYAHADNGSGQPKSYLYDYLTQEVNIPSTATSLNLSFYASATLNGGSTGNERLFVYIHDYNLGVTNVIQAINFYSSSSYQYYSFVVPSSIIGHYVELGFRAESSSTPTTFRVDDVSLKYTQQQNSCVTWVNGSPSQNAEVFYAAEYLCSKNVFEINNDVIDYQDLQYFSIKSAALSTFIGMYNGDPPSNEVSDYYPTLFTDIDDPQFEYTQALKSMLFLEYGDGRSCLSREFNQIYPLKTISYGLAVRMLLEAWDISPDFTGWNANDNSSSSFANNILKNDVNYPYFKRLSSIPSLSSGYFSGGNFNPTNQTVGEFYMVMLYRLMTQFSHPTINEARYFTPNNFAKNTGSIGSNISKAVFSEYENTTFSLPSGGLGLELTFSYHSDWIDIPSIPNSSYYYPTNSELLSQIRAKHKLYPLGLGWTHNYNTFAQVLRDENESEKYYLFKWGNGDVFIFNIQSMQFETKGIYDKITILNWSNGKPIRFLFTTKNQIKYIFYRFGESYDQFILEQISDRNDNKIIIEHEQAYCDSYPSTCINSMRLRIKQVRDIHAQRSLIFNYVLNTDLLSSISDGTRIINFNVNPTTFNLDSFTDAKGQTTSYSYCGQENCKNLLTSIIRPNGNTITNTYFKNKLKTTQTNDYRTTINFSTNYLSDGKTTKTELSTLANGQTYKAEVSHNVNGSATEVNSQTSRIYIYYEDAQNPTLPTYTRDRNTNIRENYSYDNRGNIKNYSKVSSDNLITISKTWDYNDFNDVTQHIDGNGGVLLNNYDFKGNLTHLSDPAGGLTRFNISSTGLVNYVINPSGYKTSFTYNQYGNPTHISKTLGLKEIVQEAQYDIWSRIIGTITPKSIKTEYQYDANDNNTNTILDPTGLNLSTKRYYDANDNLTQILNPKNIPTYLEYDANDDLVSEVFGANSRYWTYNSDGTRKTFKDKNGNIFNYQYFGQNDPREGFLQTDGYVFYDYDLVTRKLKTITRGSKVITYYYDTFFRISKINYNDGSISHNVEYRYDNNDNITQIIYPDGKIIYYEYNQNNKIRRIKDWLYNILVSYEYALDGRLISATNGNGTSSKYSYDGIGRADSLANIKANGSLLSSHALKLDLDGKIIGKSSNRIDGDQYPQLTEGSMNYTYDFMGRLISVNGTAVRHDNNGNQTSFGGSSFTWDIDDRLITANSPQQTFTFDYDPLGGRVRKNDNRYVVDILNDSNILMETNTIGVPSSLYVYGLGLACRYDYNSNSFSYYHLDERGSTTEISDASGNNITHKYKYDGFGNEYEGIELFSQPFKYVGKYGVVTDSKDIYFMRARYYNPQIGRFLSEDPVWSTNLYPYADNDAINNVDPNGLEPNPFTFGGTFDGLKQSLESKDYLGVVLYTAAFAGQSSIIALEILPGGEAFSQVFSVINTFGENYVNNNGNIKASIVSTAKQLAREKIVDVGFKYGPSNSIMGATYTGVNQLKKSAKKNYPKLFKQPYVKSSQRHNISKITNNSVKYLIKKQIKDL